MENNDSQDLKTCKTQLEHHNMRMMDKKPISRMKDAILQLQGDIKKMHVHTGMLQHQLLFSMLTKNGGPS